jgi:hypothetical protein
MEAARAIWTDERMDDLNHKVDKLMMTVSLAGTMVVGFASILATQL